MLLDAEARRNTRRTSFRIGFRACKATQESQNLRARRQRRSYGFAARLTLGWKADQRSARRIPQRGLVRLGNGWLLGLAVVPPALGGWWNGQAAIERLQRLAVVRSGDFHDIVVADRKSTRLNSRH